MTESKLATNGLRIVQITAVGISAKSFLIEHFRRLQHAGNEVLLVCSDDRDARDAAAAGGIRYEPITIKQSIHPVSDLLSVLRLRRLFREWRPDVIHAHMAKAGLLGTIAGWLAGVPVRIYHNHGMAMLSARGLRRRMLSTAERVTSRLATHVLFCSESTRTAGIESGVVVDERSQVLGSGTISGVDVEKFAPDPTGHLRNEQRQAWGVGEDTVVVGFVGRLVMHKGVETLIDAWRHLGATVRDRACLLLVGGNAYSEARVRSIVEDALHENIGVKTLGWVEDMVACYSGMDLLVLPSWHEGFPYGIVEAQSMKLPIVATRATGNVDAVQHEVTGLLVPVKDPVALAGALSRLIGSEQERQRFGEQGRRRILDEFTQDRVLQHLLKFYEEQIVPRAKS